MSALTIPDSIVRAIVTGAPFAWIRPADRDNALALYAAALRIAPIYYARERKQRRATRKTSQDRRSASVAF
jgi:hypothetical protein